MQRHVDQDYDNVRQLLLKMGGLVEQMISDAQKALAERDSELALTVVQADRKVDEMEKHIDESCQTILARHQPTAGDLRFLVSVMKITTDLERVGDSAANISRAVRDINHETPLPPHTEIPQLFQMARQMVRDSLDAFVQRDSQLALKVWGRDDAVDDTYAKLHADLVAAMKDDPEIAGANLRLLLMGRTLERIADHATNIAEDVIFYVEGRDIRHSATDYGDTAATPSHTQGSKP